ncbi:mannan-binding lectin serine protease 1 [Trichomycterus rosablanca]|uniref:mannan-binding lectin serine protease 1 n=1 Tax=Trichomycterus rosablanca TaxID=2290929 RepID=UPI002F356E85
MDLTGNVLLVLLLSVSPVWAQLLLLKDMYGTIQSPNYPESYPRHSKIQWNIIVPEGYQIHLYFMHFDIEPSYLCEYDYVKVFSETEELAMFCGTENTDTERVPSDDVIFSPRNMLSVEFRSDFSNDECYSGFKAHYSAVDINECREKNNEALVCDHFCHNYIGGYYCSCRFGHLLHLDNKTCKVECSDIVYTERSGLISSPDYPKPYPKSSDCLYQIKLAKGFAVTLDFDDAFSIEAHPDVTCPYDHIKIQVGERVLGPFCGDRSPGRIHTGSNVVNILFHSDNSGENLGWKLNYSSTGTECPVPLLPPNSHLEPLQSQYFFREHITVKCDPGYLLQKDEEKFEHYQITCQADGSWSSSVPLCKNLQNTTQLEFKYHLSSGQAVCGQESKPFPTQQKRIVGGQAAFPGLFPWQVLLSVKDVSRVPVDHWFGSGALLSPSWVLTAAHVLCTQRRDMSTVPVVPSHVHATLGLTDVRDKWLAFNHSVERLILHPDFDLHNYNNDIALVKLSQQVMLNELVRPVCLPPPRVNDQTPSPLPNTLGVVAGWGINTASASASNKRMNLNSGTVSNVLQYVKLPVVAQEKCQASYSLRSVNYNITENMFCAGFYEGGRDTCLGDSGGAFVIKDLHSGRWVVQGLVSWGGPEECGSQQVYGVYTRVSNYANWLNTTMEAECWK